MKRASERESETISPTRRNKGAINNIQDVIRPFATKDMVEGDTDSETEEDKLNTLGNYIKKREQQELDNEIETGKCSPCWIRFHQKTRKVVISKIFNYIILGLVLLDTFVVIGEIMLESYSQQHPGKGIDTAKHALHDISLGLLSIFVGEIPFRLIGLELEFFKDKFEVFDAFIVVLSFLISIFLTVGIIQETNGVSLLVLLRLWRITRVANGIILTVKIKAKYKRKALQMKLDRLIEVQETLLKTAIHLGEGICCITDSDIDFRTRNIVVEWQTVHQDVSSAINKELGSCPACDEAIHLGNELSAHINSSYHIAKQKTLKQQLDVVRHNRSING